MKKQGSCFNCLRRGGHLARNCDTTKIQCFKYSFRPHLAVCNSSMGSADRIDPAGATASPAMHIGSGMHVFLQTAQVSIPGKELSHSLTVPAIFDTGAQRSYINQKVVNALKLKTVRTERMKIAT